MLGESEQRRRPSARRPSRPASEARRVDRRIAASIALGSFLFYLPFVPGHFYGTDEVEVFSTTQSLYERGDLAIEPILHTFVGRDGRVYSTFAVGQSVLALPFYALGRSADRLLPESWSAALAGPDRVSGGVRFGGTVEIFAVGLYAPLASALLLGLFYLFERRLGASRVSAQVATLLLGTCTYVATMSVFFLRHTTETLAILGSLYCLYGWKTRGSLPSLALGSFLASATLLVRAPSAVVGPALAAYAAWALRAVTRTGRSGNRLAVAFAALFVPPLLTAAVHMASNFVKWGTLVASPMLSQGVHSTGSPSIGLVGLLLSPGASIFVYSPLLLLCPWTLAPFWRSHRAECLAVLVACLSLLLVSARFSNWHGLWSAPGPRMLFAATPLLMLPLGRWLDGNRSDRELAALFTLAGFGFVVQLLLMWVSWRDVIHAMNYNAVLPGIGFLFDVSRMPLTGHALLLVRGEHGSWVAALLEAGGGRAPAVGVLAVGWTLLFTWNARRLTRAVAEAPRDA